MGRKWPEADRARSHVLRGQTQNFRSFRPVAVHSGDMVKGLKRGSDIIRTRKNVDSRVRRPKAPEGASTELNSGAKGYCGYDAPTWPAVAAFLTHPVIFMMVNVVSILHFSFWASADTNNLPFLNFGFYSFYS